MPCAAADRNLRDEPVSPPNKVGWLLSKTRLTHRRRRFQDLAMESPRVRRASTLVIGSGPWPKLTPTRPQSLLLMLADRSERSPGASLKQ